MRAFGFSFITLVACNSFTGASGLDIDDEGGGKDKSPFAAADGIAITRIDIYQGIRRPLMEDGVPATSTVPLVRGRDALMRIHYEVEKPVTALTARLTIGEGEPIEVLTTAGVTSSDEVLGSTINITIPGEAMEGLDYRIALLQPREQTSGQNKAAFHPAPSEDPALLPLQTSGPMRLVIVPIEYNADGSGRLPDTSETQLALIEKTFYGMFPVPAVDIEVATPLPSNIAVSSVSGWGELLSELREHRAKVAAPAEEYYLGLFMARDTFSEFCMGGCITGLSNLAMSAGDSLSRTSIAIGFPGQATADTAAHEVGHAHGRQHAPCNNPGGVDPEFPYATGEIGTWGFDLTTGQLKNPSTPDFMSYCDPAWVSDYTYEALFARGQLVNVAAAVAGPATEYDQVLIGPDGSASFRGRLTLREPLGGAPTALVLDEDIPTSGFYYPHDHLPGGLLLLPASDAVRVRFSAGGRDHDVRR